MRIVIAAHTFEGGDFVVGSHHLAREFERRGHEVMHVSTAITPLHLARLRDSTVRTRFALARRRPTWRSGAQVVPVRCFPDGRTRRRIPSRAGRLQRWWLGRLDLDAVDLVLIDQPALAWLLAHTTAAAVVYRPTDVYADLSGHGHVEALERYILDRAVGAVATSTVVLEHVEELMPVGLATIVVENGVEYEHLRTAVDHARAESSTRRPVASYVGALDDRFDWNGVIRAAETLPGIDFALYGPTDRSGALPPNVTLHGAIAYRAIPGVLAQADVGLLPLSDHPGNTGRSPMKFYEYQAAGLPVVSRATPELERRAGENVEMYAYSDGLADALRAALAARPDRAAISRSARHFDWAAKAEQIEAFVERCVASAGT